MTGVLRLVIDDGPDAGLVIEIDRAHILGRETEGVQLSDGRVSRVHAEIHPAAGGGAEIADLGSRNGTFVNGTRITTTTALHAGDQILLGGAILRVEGDADADEASDATVTADIPVAIAGAADQQATEQSTRPPSTPMVAAPPPAPITPSAIPVVIPVMTAEAPPVAAARPVPPPPAVVAAPAPLRPAAGPLVASAAPPLAAAASPIPFGPSSHSGHRTAATRRADAVVVCFVLIGLTAVALLAYFALR